MSLRRLAERLPYARRLYRWLNRDHLHVLAAVAAFAPNSAGSHRVRAEMALQGVRQTLPLLAQLAGSMTECDTATFALDEAVRLKALLDRYGSDKASRHDYHLIYGRILAQPIRAMLEVGLGTNNEDVISNMGREGKPGASLRVFRDFLPEAQVFGADIDRRILFAEDRITTYYVDQTDPASVDALGAQLPELDLVIDDGLHAPHANLAVVALAVRKLRPGGWVVVEDIADEAAPLWRVVGSLLPWEAWLIHAKGGLVFTARRA